MLIGKKQFLILAAFAACVFGCASCKQEDDPFTGIKIASSATTGDAGGTVSITATYYNEDTADASSTVTYTLSADSTGGAYFGTSGTLTTTGTSGSAVTLTLGSTGGESVTVTATCNSSSASKKIYTKTTTSVTDTPTGYAGVDWVSFYDSEKLVTVTT